MIVHRVLARLLLWIVVNQSVTALLLARPHSSSVMRAYSSADTFSVSSSQSIRSRHHHKASARSVQQIFLSPHENNVPNLKEENRDLIVQEDANQIASSMKNPEEILSEERRVNLFQFLLRDLQVEGVPLLAVDADQIHTMQAAIWTTMAELWASTDSVMGEEDVPLQKACLIFEDIPVDALRIFVQDFRILQTQDRLMNSLPDLSQFHLSMVGKGVGPAILIRLDSKTSKETESYATTYNVDPNPAIASMKMFVDRVIKDMNVCPHFSEAEKESSSSPLTSAMDTVQYRVCGFSDVCHVLSAFWNCICELQATRPDQISSILLLLPTVSALESEDLAHHFNERHDRFAAITELISRSLCLYRGNDVFEILHFDPRYTRDKIYPLDRPAHGHLPQSSWLSPMLAHLGHSNVNHNDEIALQKLNYQRRAPMTAVCIKRASEMNNPVSPSQSVAREDLVIDNVTIPARTVETYVKNILRFAEEDEATLQADLQKEIQISHQSHPQ